MPVTRKEAKKRCADERGMESLPRSVKRKEKDSSESESERAAIVCFVRRWCELAKNKGLSLLSLAVMKGDKEGVEAILKCTSDMVENESEEVKEYMKESVEERVNKIDEGTVRCILHSVCQFIIVVDLTQSHSLFVTPVAKTLAAIVRCAVWTQRHRSSADRS